MYPFINHNQNDVISKMFWKNLHTLFYTLEEEEISARRERREPVILPHFSAHHLRHTFCTRLCMTDLSIKEIQDIMGHADINTTMNIYAEVHPDMKKKSLTKMAGKIIINRSDMSINEAIAYEDEDDVE